MTILEMIKNKIFKRGVVKVTAPSDRDTFINNEGDLTKQRLEEYNIWYEGDGDELLNYYTKENVIDYNYEPFYSRNKKNYFWAISSTEADIKRTHSGMPRNIIDTLVAIMKFPIINAGRLDTKDNAVTNNLKKIIEDCDLEGLYQQEQMPLTLVEGWGCYKINWDIDESDYPSISYYRAKDVDFIYKNNRIIGVIFKDYYTEDNSTYMLVESRRLEVIDHQRVLVIENELFEMQSKEQVVKVPLDRLKQLESTPERIEIGPVGAKCLLAVPTIFFKNTSEKGGYGRSIFTGKLDLFDDLDQCLSQSSNSVRKSTPVEYFNSEYLERGADGLPKQPHAYDRKYSVYEGQRDSNGGVTGDPVTVTQPQIDFSRYSNEAISIMLHIINGIVSPATLGIDIAKKDNAEAQREKEKVTIFTRNAILGIEGKILKSLCNQLLIAYEFMHDGKITVSDYDISVKFSEFADESFETKLEKLGAAFGGENMSEKMYMNKLYGDTLNEREYEEELEWLKEHHTQVQDQAMLGATGGGANVMGMLGKDQDAPKSKEDLDDIM